MPNFRSPFAQTIIQLFNQLIDAGYDLAAIEQIRDGWLVARRLFACRVMSSGKIFLAHTIGTASALVSENARPALVVAGLLHNVYNNGRFKDGGRGAGVNRRAQVRELIGDDAEDLVYRFWSTPWTREDLEPWLLKDTLDDAERDLLALRLADAIDHATSLGLSYSTKPVNLRRFERVNESMMTLARTHGFGRLASAWSAELARYETESVEPEVAHESPSHTYSVVPRSYRGSFSHKLRRAFNRPVN